MCEGDWSGVLEDLLMVVAQGCSWLLGVRLGVFSVAGKSPESCRKVGNALPRNSADAE